MEALERVEDGRADFAAVLLADLLASPTAYSTATVAVPLVGVAVAVAFCFDGDLADQPLTLDAETLFAVFSGNIRYWRDSRLVRLNGWMAEEPYASALGANEVRVIGAEDTTIDRVS